MFPAGDLGIVKAIQKAYNLRKTPDVKRLHAIAERWRPYRSVASWYLLGKPRKTRWMRESEKLVESKRHEKIFALLTVVFASVLTLDAQGQPDIPKLDVEKYIGQRARGDPLGGTAARRRGRVVARGARPRGTGANGLRAPVRAHDVRDRSTSSDAHFKLLAGGGATGVNGTTDFDRTNYFETMPSNQLELALWLESDRMGYLLETVDRPALESAGRRP